MVGPDIAQTLKVLDTTGDTPDPTRFTTSSGIVFRLKPVSPLLVVDATRRIAAPQPPRVHIEDKDTYEENPHDPDYIRAHQVYMATVGEVSNAILLTRGAELVEVPEGIERPEDTDWSSDVTEFTELEIPSQEENKRRRYYLWLKYVALQHMDDLQGLVASISKLGGMTLEVDAAQAAERFPSEPNGDTVN